MVKFITIDEDGSMTYTQKATECPQGMVRFDGIVWVVSSE